ncbi:hypothetical protein [Bradyrhizobium sp. USDA 4452]
MTMRAGEERTLRGRVAVIGIGETEYYRHGAPPLFGTETRQSEWIAGFLFLEANVAPQRYQRLGLVVRNTGNLLRSAERERARTTEANLPWPSRVA